MLLKDYISAAKTFAAETQEWGNLNGYSFYTTTGDAWEESCDNASGGIDISWAFHESAEKIEKEAGQHFINEIPTAWSKVLTRVGMLISCRKS